MRGRPSKYKTNEELVQARRDSTKKSYERRLRERGRDAVTNPCKRRKIKSIGINSEIGTLDRTKINTAYIEMYVSVTYTDDDDKLKEFKMDCRDAFYDWLNGQDMWDRNKHIDIFETKPTNRNYKGKIKTFTLQCHVIRDFEKITSWKDTVDNLTPLVLSLIDTIKKTCLKTGLMLETWGGTNLDERIDFNE